MRRVSLVAFALTACVNSRQAVDHKAGAVDATVASLALTGHRLDQAKEEKWDGHLAGSLPSWVFAGGLEWVEDEREDAVRTLRAIISRERDPRLIALAILRLSARADPSDLEVIEAYLEADQEGDQAIGSLPVRALPTRRARPLSWRPYTLVEVALIGVSRITFAEHGDVAGYQKWRKVQGNLDRSFEYLARALSHAQSDERKRARLQVVQDRPGIFARLALAEEGRLGLSDEVLIEALSQAFSPGELEAILSGETTFAEHAGRPERFSRFATFVVTHAALLLAPDPDDRATRLVALFERLESPFAPHLRVVLAAAAAEANLQNESARTAVLQRALRIQGTHAYGPALRVLAAHGAQDALLPWLKARNAPKNKVAIFEGLRQRADAKPEESRAVLAKVLPSFQTDDAQVIASLARLSLDLGSTVPLGCADLLQLRGALPARCLQDIKAQHTP